MFPRSLLSGSVFSGLYPSRLSSGWFLRVTWDGRQWKEQKFFGKKSSAKLLSQGHVVVGKRGKQRRRVLVRLPLKLAFARVRSCEQAGKRVTSWVQNASGEAVCPRPAQPPRGPVPASPYLCLTELLTLYDQHTHTESTLLFLCSFFQLYGVFLTILIRPGGCCGEIPCISGVRGVHKTGSSLSSKTRVGIFHNRFF